MSNTSLSDDRDRWIEAWDRQQESYVVAREERFTAVIDTLEGLLGQHGDRGDDKSPPLLDLYVGLLQDAGFAVVDTVWQRFDDRVLVAMSTP